MGSVEVTVKECQQGNQLFSTCGMMEMRKQRQLRNNKSRCLLKVLTLLQMKLNVIEWTKCKNPSLQLLVEQFIPVRINCMRK